MTVEEAKKEADALGRKLNPKQRLWAEKYLVAGNATEAAIAAGYAAKNAAVQGAKLKATPKVAEYLAARETQLFEEMGINEGWVGRRFAEVFARCMDATPHLSWDPSAREYRPDGTWVFDARGAIASLTALGKKLGMFKDSEDPENTGQTIEEWLEQQRRESGP